MMQLMYPSVGNMQNDARIFIKKHQQIYITMSSCRKCIDLRCTKKEKAPPK